MASMLPPDPYAALGVARDAPSATIKQTYRKLALKCHPDKVTDESLKQQKQEEFHRIQQAYELIGEEDKRKAYDAEVRLEQLRRETLARKGTAGPTADAKAARYDVRTAAPAASAGATYTTTRPSQYEERKPASRSYDEDRYYESRKYDTYPAFPKHSSTSRSTRPEKESPRASKTTSDRTRSDRNRTRDREERRDRSNKFVYVDDDSSSTDEKARFEQGYYRRGSDEDARGKAAEARRKAGHEYDRRSYEEPKDSRRHQSADEEPEWMRDLNDKSAEAVRHIRTSSTRETRPDYDSRHSRRPEPVRRSSARPSKERPSTSGREAPRSRVVVPEIVEWGEHREPPPFKHSSSSPDTIHVPRGPPQRSYTESSRDHRRVETSPKAPTFRRAETMPTVTQSSSSRRKEPRPSGLRSSETTSPREGGYSGSPPKVSYSTVPPAETSSTRKFYYQTPSGGVTLHPDDMGKANGHHTVLREPGGRRRSPSPTPITRPPMGANRNLDASSTQSPPAAPAPPRQSGYNVPPPLMRSATTQATPFRGEDRGRSGSGRLYGEMPSDYPRRDSGRRNYSPENVSYAKRYTNDDVRYARGHDDRDYHARPTLGRHPTYVCT